MIDLWDRFCETLSVPRRLRPALAVAIAASLAAVALSTIPVLLIWESVEYSPQVAVTTATLVAIILYTFFTYWAANRRERGYALLSLERDGLRLIPEVTNPTNRTLRARLYLRVWVDDDELERGSFYRGDEEFVLPPEGEFAGSVSLWDEIRIGRDEVGEPIIARDQLRAALRVEWLDDLGEEGENGPQYYRAPFEARGRLVAVVSKESFRAHFPELRNESEWRPTSSREPSSSD